MQPKRSIWILLLGIALIGNAAACLCFSIINPLSGTVYFWFARFYEHLSLPTALLLPVGFSLVLVWASQWIKTAWLRKAVSDAGAVLVFLIFIITLGCALFIPPLRFAGQLEQNGRTYYLVKAYDDLSYDLFACEADRLGFSGACQRFTWMPAEARDPQFYIDPATGLITIAFPSAEAIPSSSHIWRVQSEPLTIYPEP